MKRIVAALIVLIMMIGLCGVCAAAEDESIGIAVTGNWYIFSKNMEDKKLLDAVGMSAREINKILENTSSKSIIVNSQTGACIYVKIDENDKSRELWNISETDDSYLVANLDDILHKAFSIHELDYDAQNVKVSMDNPYVKQLIIPGSTHYENAAHGMVVSATIVNGKAVAFVMETAGETPTQEEIAALEEVTRGIEITKIRNKGEVEAEEPKEKSDITRYVIGGIVAVVAVGLCVLAMKKMKNNDEEENEENEE